MAEKHTNVRLSCVGYRRGARMAIEMLDALYDDDIFAFEDDTRDGPQNNVVLKFLERVIDQRDRLVLEGFAAVLTDVVAFNTANDIGATFERAFRPNVCQSGRSADC